MQQRRRYTMLRKRHSSTQRCDITASDVYHCLYTWPLSIKVPWHVQAKSSQQYKSSRMDKPANPTKQQQKLDVKIYGDGGAAGVSGTQKKKPPPQASSRHSSGTAKHAQAVPSKPKEIPIILVPESEAALVNLFNVKELLQVCCKTLPLPQTQYTG